jgi:hypothetical protein
MSPHVQHRQRRVLVEADTGAVEWWVSVSMMAYAAYLIWPGSEPLPWRVIWYAPNWLTEQTIGWALLALSFFQWFVSDTKRSVLRYIAAASLWVALGYTLLLYWKASEIDRRIVPIIAVAALAEFWIAWRAGHDRRTRVVLQKELRNGG